MCRADAPGARDSPLPTPAKVSAGSRLLGQPGSPYDRMPKERPGDDRYSDRGRHQPVGDRRKLLPERQALSVVHVKGGQQQDIGQPHSADVHAGPPGPATTAGATANDGGRKGKDAENEQMIVLGPSHR